MHETPGLDGTEFDNRLRSLQKLLKETWKKIEYAFRIDTEHEIKKMETDLKKIKEGPFEDLRVYLKELARFDGQRVSCKYERDIQELPFRGS